MCFSVPLAGKDKAVEVETLSPLVKLLEDDSAHVRANAAGAIMTYVFIIETHSHPAHMVLHKKNTLMTKQYFQKYSTESRRSCWVKQSLFKYISNTLEHI